ncbi:hypothetical protein CO168_01370 [Candidatus Shapirobacteria bacterium CG_4_9_14_3_um_filter_36_12]|uniref:Uncharacterized protein n=3 Tax=Candidatus Shapironibacteriota TaxID=1752721 RepID=A0A1J5I8H5_9BACT|nr:MAG: hypothetical protein AUK05_01115 [Candidatus Shapirobacteria bacterium CG2_30_35_20]PJA51140.1 MAG: hypothetical protein CO168_01370 [Candidatus Shapirobacteria bacterium CG_4_9_14_3_um_filter_36_12]
MAKKIIRKNRNKNFIIGVVILATIFIVILTYVVINKKQTDSEILPIKIVETNIATEKIGLVEGKPAPCQPDYFDPKISKFYKVKNDGILSEMYQVEGLEVGAGMMIDGWNKEGENKINLPSPYKVTVYRFGCASSFSSVLDLYKNNQRRALFTHVLHYSFSDDGKYMFLVHNVKNNDNWELHKQIINLETKTVVEFPNISCVSSLDGFWQGDRLLTYVPLQNGMQTDVCIWDKNAKMVSRLNTPSHWGAASRDFLAEPIGLLPNNPDIFYAYTSKNDNICSLFMVDLVKKSPIKSVDILDKRNYSENYFCASPEVEFDFLNTNFDEGTLKYKVSKGEWKTKSLN